MTPTTGLILDPMNTQPKNERDFSITLALSIGLNFGGLLAIAQALHIGNSGMSFKVSVWTAIAFLAGFSSAYAYLRHVLVCGDKASRAFRHGGLVVLVLMVVGAFLYPLRSLAIERLADRFGGTLAALCFIATGLTMIRTAVHAAEREEEEEEAEERKSASSGSGAQAEPVPNDSGHDA